MPLVMTTKGLLDRAELEVEHEFQDTETSHDVATVYLYQGEIVRRDVAVSILRPLDLAGEQSSV